MRKIILLPALLMCMLTAVITQAATSVYHIKQQDIHEGDIVEHIWLDHYAVPQIKISGITYSANAVLPKAAKAGDPLKFTVSIGMDRKRPFAVVHIPAYVANGSAVSQVAGFTLDVTEQAAAQKMTAAFADIGTSVLASGTWYKIGITKTGFYKLDYNFISSLGISPSSVNPANIRIFGNGGHMLSEDNAVPRAADLVENAIEINAGSDSTFNTGDNVIFYATGTTEWDKDSTHQRFTHINNLYTDTAYYFITFDKGPGLHIATQAPKATTGTVQTVTSFNYYDEHETDLINTAEIGRKWYGETFNPQIGNTSQTFSFDFGTPVTNVYCQVSMGSTSDIANSELGISLNGTVIASTVFPSSTASGTDNLMTIINPSGTGPCNAQIANIGLNFIPADGTSIGYLYYIEVNARRSLLMTADQMNFRDWQSVGPGNTAGYQLQGANSSTEVWDVTNPQVPVIMNGSLAGTTYSFTQDAQMLHEFAAMNSHNLFTPVFSGNVANQNLHGSGQVDCIIVTYPDFLDEATQLAAYHTSHDNMHVIVATTTQVYNEFSSGAQDISAIRDFARMFYKRAGTDSTKLPRYLTLFGGASYDYKHRLANNSNFVPVFESPESSSDIDCFSTDDFYGFLDDNENIENTSIINAMDVGVGRLPARSEADAAALVNKIIHYADPATLGQWRTSATIVADKGCNDDAGDHMDVAEVMAAEVTTAGNNLYDLNKVYVDALAITSTPAGPRCPDANTAIDNQVFKGTFLINYNGHGNPEVWSSERILSEDDYNNWNNTTMLPFMVTATCDFGQFDHPQFVSAAEQLVIRSGGGVIAVLTTTEAVYSGFNQDLDQHYLAAQFTRNSIGNWNSFGDASRIGKNVTYNISKSAEELYNFRKFSLLGDPALTPDFPQYNIVLDSIVDGATKLRADTVKALGAYIIDGSVKDNNGNVINGFNGQLAVSFFDKPRQITTISGCNEVFSVQDNIVYKGKVTVTNGHYSLTFIAPKDINYYYGSGKISTYAQNGVTDGSGTDTSATVGGYSDNPVISTTPPVVKAFINDSLFQNGGITGTNTSLFVSLYDNTGINVSGTNIGHDLTAVLDGNVENPYILNDYYQTAPNTYQYGSVNFPITGLADGKHTITVKAWDVNDNSGEGSVDFVVVNGAVMDIQNLMNYPNPFNNGTTFVFEHNHPNELLKVEINIFNMGGSLVKTITQDFTPSDSRTNELTWDGRANDGGRLPSGVYVYRLNISTEKGFKSSAYQKLVIVR